MCGTDCDTRNASVTSPIFLPGRTATMFFLAVVKPLDPITRSPAMTGEAMALCLNVPKTSICQFLFPESAATPQMPW